MSTVSERLDSYNEIDSAEKAVDMATEALNAAREQLRNAAEMLRQAENNLVMVQQKHGVPVPEWPEHPMSGRRWWAAVNGGCPRIE
jgi:hypothetical protein